MKCLSEIQQKNNPSQAFQGDYGILRSSSHWQANGCPATGDRLDCGAEPLGGNAHRLWLSHSWGGECSLPSPTTRRGEWLRVMTMTINCGNIASHSSTYMVVSSPRRLRLATMTAPYWKGKGTEDEWLPPVGGPLWTGMRGIVFPSSLHMTLILPWPLCSFTWL